MESDEEEVTRSSEHFLQYNCYIDKEVKYLHSGLVNVRKSDCVDTYYMSVRAEDEVVLNCRG